ncbi:MAG: heme ABC exporter ATP-binding protein CcmA, partial [Rhodospirillales bacterium]
MATFCGNELLCIRGERTVFSQLSFSLSDGGALLLIGPNGTGKSSLLRVMAGLLPVELGTVSWDGEAISEDPEAHGARLHYVGHHDAVKPVLTVAENLGFWADIRPGGGPERVRQALADLEMDHLADLPGRFLSAGQKRRVNLARILAAPAPLWLLDEPTTALDKATVNKLEALIAAHRADGGMVVLSTHAEIDLPGARVLDLADHTHRPSGNRRADVGVPA